MTMLDKMVASFTTFYGRKIMQIGYVRVSTNDQNTALQRNALECAGCELIFEDKMSGKTSDRPGLPPLENLMLRQRITDQYLLDFSSQVSA